MQKEKGKFESQWEWKTATEIYKGKEIKKAVKKKNNGDLHMLKSICRTPYKNKFPHFQY